MIIKEKHDFYEFEIFSQEVKYSFKVNKKNAAYVYAILEGNENLCLYSTVTHSPRESIIECFTTAERKQEMLFLINNLIEENIIVLFDF